MNCTHFKGLNNYEYGYSIPLHYICECGIYYYNLALFLRICDPVCRFRFELVFCKYKCVNICKYKDWLNVKFEWGERTKIPKFLKFTKKEFA